METIDNLNEVQRPKTYFEDVIGWVFLIMGGYQVLKGVFDLIISDMSELYDLLADPDFMAFISVFPFMDYIIENIVLIMNLLLLYNLAMVVCSIGLLKRWNWARMGFIVVMSISILQSLLGFIYIHVGYPYAVTFIEDNMESGDVTLFKNILLGVVIFLDFICLVFIGLYAWIAYRLGTEKIKARFRTDFVK